MIHIRHARAFLLFAGVLSSLSLHSSFVLSTSHTLVATYYSTYHSELVFQY